jgi:hypothetical protein
MCNGHRAARPRTPAGEVERDPAACRAQITRQRRQRGALSRLPGRMHDGIMPLLDERAGLRKALLSRTV